MKDGLVQLIIRDLQLESTAAPLDADEMLQWLADHVAYLLEYRLDFLMSLMYRLDISEAAVGKAISPINPEPANIALAQLILERQRERLFTKNYYVQGHIENIDDNLKW